MKKKNKNKGVLIWITGLSGAGKTSLANQIKKKIKVNYGPTLLINGDDLRKIFKLNKYDKSSRLKYVKQYSELVRFITNQGINVIFTVVGLFDSIRNWNIFLVLFKGSLCTNLISFSLSLITVSMNLNSS